MCLKSRLTVEVGFRGCRGVVLGSACVTVRSAGEGELLLMLIVVLGLECSGCGWIFFRKVGRGTQVYHALGTTLVSLLSLLPCLFQRAGGLAFFTIHLYHRGLAPRRTFVFPFKRESLPACHPGARTVFHFELTVGFRDRWALGQKDRRNDVATTQSFLCAWL